MPQEIPQRLCGHRVSIRPVQIKDASAIITCLNIASVVPSNLAFFSNGIPTLKQEIDWIRATLRRMKSEQEIVFAVETLAGGDFIGTAGLHEIDHKNKNARIGITIFNEEFLGQRYAREIIGLLHDQAFYWMGLKKVFMNFRSDNEKMRHIVQVCGYREVGVLEKEYFWKGEWFDFVRYELVSEYKYKKMQ